MARATEVGYVLSDCFLAVGQAVGPDKAVDFDTVTWWHDRYRQFFHEAMIARGTSWAADRNRVTAVGRYLGQRVVKYAGGRTTIDRAVAAIASAEVERGCQMNATRDGAPVGRLYEFGNAGVLPLAGIFDRPMPFRQGR